jgi:NAD(P)-dependent dehydrogenase (short-subunit alcohol dehydrogenase family)
MDLQLAGRTVLVTGGSKGIGLAVAKGFAAEGCRLHIAARTRADLDRAAHAIKATANVAVEVHDVDLAKPGAAAALAESCGDIDVLVNNAGAIPGGTIATIDEARWRDAWDLKVFGYVNLARAVYERMKARRAGAIVNIIGLAAERPSANNIAGSTGNAALVAFTRALGGSSLDDGVRVLGVNPGFVETDRMVTLLKTRAQQAFGDAERWREVLAQMKLPLGRAARPEEVADVVVFLASPRAGYVSGTVVTIDGGAGVRG